VEIVIARSFDKEVITMLLDQRGANVPITEEVAKAAAENYRNNKEVMAVLLDRRGVTNSINRGMSRARSGRQPVQLAVLNTRI
jgi:hypothetical protein